MSLKINYEKKTKQNKFVVEDKRSGISYIYLIEYCN